MFVNLNPYIRSPPVSEIEDFEEAYVRLQWTPELLAKQIKRFLGYFYLFILLAISFFFYAFIIGKHGNVMGTFMSTAVGIYSLSLAFRFHFWRYELQRRKLGCTFKEWFRDFYQGSH